MHFSWLNYVTGKHGVDGVVGHLAEHISFHLHCANHLPPYTGK